MEAEMISNLNREELGQGGHLREHPSRAHKSRCNTSSPFDEELNICKINGSLFI
jgi:hypothetical protein